MSWLGAVPVLWAMRRATGMKMATTPVELMKAPEPGHRRHQQDEQSGLAALALWR